jgi:hypothetical protein
MTPIIQVGGTISGFIWPSSVVSVGSPWQEKTRTIEDYFPYSEINDRNEQTAFEASALNHFRNERIWWLNYIV